jgi:hypothetical protein
MGKAGLFGILISTICLAGFATQAAKETQANSGKGDSANLTVTLLKPVDAGTAKPGDPVTARVIEPGHGLVKGTKVVGHVVAVKARGEEQPSSELVIAFTSTIDAHGKESPFSGEIASVARAQGAAPPTDAGAGDMGVPSPSMGTRGAPSRGGRSGGGIIGPPASNTPNASGSADEKPDTASFTLQQRGNGSVISSNSQNVHLDAGTKLLLKVTGSE